MTNLWLRLSKREKIIVSFGGLVFVLLLARFFIVNPYLARRAWVTDQLEIRARQSWNSTRYLSRREKLEERLRMLRARLAKLDASLLEGSTPPVIASSLQETVRGIASREGVRIVATRVLSPEPVGSFLKVPIQVEADGTMEQMARLIKGIDTSEQLLVVNEISVRSLRRNTRRRRLKQAPQTSGGVRASMVIAGFARVSNGADGVEDPNRAF